MSAMDPMYGIPAVIRYGISLFNCWESKELVEAGLQDYRERLNEYGDELMPEYVAKNMDYIDNLEAYIQEIMAKLREMGYEVSDDFILDLEDLGIVLDESKTRLHKVIGDIPKTEKKEPKFSSVQRFSRHVFADYNKKFSSQIELMLVAQYVIDIAKEELKKYMPEQQKSGDDRALSKTPKNID